MKSDAQISKELKQARLTRKKLSLALYQALTRSDLLQEMYQEINRVRFNLTLPDLNPDPQKAAEQIEEILSMEPGLVDEQEWMETSPEFRSEQLIRHLQSSLSPALLDG